MQSVASLPRLLMQPPIEDIIRGGLVALWRFDEATGQILQDYSGGGNYGILGATTAASTNDPEWVKGGLLFTNSSSQYVTLRDTTVGGVNLLASSGNPWTVQVYSACQTIAAASTRTIIAKCSGTEAARTFQLYYDGVSRIKAILRGTTSTIKDPTDTAYHLITITWDGTTAKAYYDNTTPISLSVGAADDESTQVVTIGVRTIGALNSYFDGTIAFAALYNRALTKDEIANNQSYILRYLGTRGIGKGN
jgi:hypothetical protein